MNTRRFYFFESLNGALQFTFERAARVYFLDKIGHAEVGLVEEFVPHAVRLGEAGLGQGHSRLIDLVLVNEDRAAVVFQFVLVVGLGELFRDRGGVLGFEVGVQRTVCVSGRGSLGPDHQAHQPEERKDNERTGDDLLLERKTLPDGRQLGDELLEELRHSILL